MHGVHGVPKMDCDKGGAVSFVMFGYSSQLVCVAARSESAAAGSPLTLNNGKPPAEGSPKFEGHLGSPTQVMDMDTALINLLATCRGVLMHYRLPP